MKTRAALAKGFISLRAGQSHPGPRSRLMLETRKFRMLTGYRGARTSLARNQ